jgi:hypothetical protein
MPPLVPLPGAAVERNGSSDWIETHAGKRRLRTFDGIRGTWRLTALGKRHFATHRPPSEYVIKLPAIFRTMRQDGTTMTHRGWFPVADLSLHVRTLIQNAMRLAAGGGRAYAMRFAKQKVTESLNARIDPATQEKVLVFMSDQLVTLDESGRPWQISELRTSVVGNRADVEAFLDIPMRSATPT